MSKSERKHRTAVQPARACPPGRPGPQKAKSNRLKAPLKLWRPSRFDHILPPFFVCPQLVLDKLVLPLETGGSPPDNYHIRPFRSLLLFLPDFGHVVFVFGPSIFLGQAQQSVPVLFQILSFCITAFGSFAKSFQRWSQCSSPLGSQNSCAVRKYSRWRSGKGEQS